MICSRVCRRRSTPPRPIEIHRAASGEVDEAVDWYLARSAAVAIRLLREFHDVKRRIEANPKQFPSLEPPDRAALLGTLPYFVVFDDTAEVVRILAFSHVRRRRGYWRDRRN